MGNTHIRKDRTAACRAGPCGPARQSWDIRAAGRDAQTGTAKIVANTDPPLPEVWLAARAGAYHYKWVQGRWLDTRDGSEFLAALSRHASAQAGKALQFDAG